MQGLRRVRAPGHRLLSLHVITLDFPQKLSKAQLDASTDLPDTKQVPHTNNARLPNCTQTIQTSTLHSEARSLPSTMPRLNLGLPFSKCDDPDCFRITGLQRCGGCSIALYCGPGHQRSNWPRHKVQCGPIKEMRAKFQAEEARVRAKLGDTTIPDNYFAHVHGDTVPSQYMDARSNLMTAILNIRTGEACEAALGHCLEMLRLCRGDNMGARAKVPALYLRLGRDQEAFDFIKWYAANASTYNWSNAELPFLNMQGEDALELDANVEKVIQLTYLSAMTLLKVRLMFDLSALQDEVAKVAPGTMTAEKKMEYLREEALSDVLLSRPDIVNRADYTDLVTDLREQCFKMYAVVKRRNKFFWPALLNPDKYAVAIPGAYTLGSEAETVLAFRESWYSWSETAPAINFIRSVTQKDMSQGGYA
jgi:hypothetical protein